MAYKHQLEKLQKQIAITGAGGFKDIVELIDNGTFYDELTEEQQIRYQEFKKSIGGVPRDVAGAELDILFNDTPVEIAYHFQLSKREKPPTAEEHARNVAEIEKLLFD